MRRIRTRGALVAALAMGGVLALPLDASAQPAPAKAVDESEVAGTVVAIDGEDLILDLGADKGVSPGDAVEIWRTLQVKHPVTGKLLVDRFRIGDLELGQVRKSLSMARPKGELERSPEKGDLVILTARRRAVVLPSPPGATPPAGPPSPPAATSSSGAGGGDPEGQIVSSMIERLRGADLVTRIRAYEGFVRARPQSRYAPTLFEEAAALRELAGRGRRPAEGSLPQARPAARSFEPPKEAYEGQPLRIGVELNDGASGAVLHVRRRGAPSFSSSPMAPVSEHFYAATIPGEKMDPADVEYFIEATDPRGQAIPVEGTAEAPLDIDVRSVPRPLAPKRAHAKASVLTDYADYNRFRGNDRAWQTEGDVGVRFGDTGVRALRTGFGVYRGVGGSVEELDVQGSEGRKVGLTYGYLETEIGAMPSFSIIGRGVVGLLDDGISGGGQLLFRIGSDLKTNLLLGGEALGGIGLRSITQLELATFERFPIVLRTEVTNQPAGSAPRPDQTKPGIAQRDGEVGARGIAQIGFRIVPALVVAARGSFQGRTIKHAGPGFGGGVSYEW